MPEPISATAAAKASYAAAGCCVPMLTIFGVNMGLQLNVLFAGFVGSLAAISLLNLVPSTGDTWQHLVRTTFKRMFFTLASSAVAGYLTPMVMVLANMSDATFLGIAFGIGGGAQRVLLWSISKITPGAPPSPPAGGANP